MAPEESVKVLKAGFDELSRCYRRLARRGQSLDGDPGASNDQDKLVSPHTRVLELVDQGSKVEHEADVGNLESWWARPHTDITNDRLERIRRAVAVSSLLESTQSSNGHAVNNDASAGMTQPMPSITESPLELDFTTSGVPSKLDCPFTALSKRRLSPHAASVVARYRSNGTRTPRSSVSRIDGRASSVARSAAGSGTDQDGGICGALEAPRKLGGSVQAAGGVCPIRFLDKNTPEEIAEYFEQHKHEVPRSHEVCVKRYQGDSKSLQELDAKYGSLVSMIKGLGEKHAPMLPGRVSEDADEEVNDKETEERVRKWSQAIKAADLPDAVLSEEVADNARLSHFDRPMKDVRVGESPSRPWGIHVPSADVPEENGPDERGRSEPARCPFGFDSSQPLPADHPVIPARKPVETSAEVVTAHVSPTTRRAVFIAGGSDLAQEATKTANKVSSMSSGPIFIGYSAEDALKIMKGMDP